MDGLYKVDTKDEIVMIGRLKENDDSAFRSLFEEYKRLVFHMAYRLTGNVHEAEDVVQEVFIKIHRGIKGFRQECSLKTWILKITINLCRNYYRRKRLFSFLSLSRGSQGDEEDPPFEISTQEDPSETVFHRQRLEILNKAMEGLPRRQREVFIMKHLEEMKIREIAEVLGCSEGAVKAHLFKAIHRLLPMMKEMER